jgi:DNA-binding LacI/PurR family transcriptional regulator
MRDMLITAGYRVPEDMGLAACSVLDGNADAGIYQKPEEIGRAAMELLISLINHQHTGIPKSCRQVLVEGEWVDGATLPRRSRA